MARVFRFTNNQPTPAPSRIDESSLTENGDAASSVAVPIAHSLSLAELNQFFYDAENISNIIEVILRGKMNTVDVPKLLETMDSMYVFLSKRAQSEFLETIVSETNKTKYLEIGVKLHNKSRNLVANQYLEIRTQIRVICAWIFIHFGERTSKVYLIIVKLFAKTGYDFHYHLGKDSSAGEDGTENKPNNPTSLSPRSRKMLSRAFDCYGVVITLYDNSEELDIYHRLPPLEIQEVRMAVFRCLLGSMQILHQLGGYPDIIHDSPATLSAEEQQLRDQTLQKELQRRIQLARSMVPSLHLRYRISLVELLFEITNKATIGEEDKKVIMDESLQYYTISLDILEIPNDRLPISLEGGSKEVVIDPEEDLALQRRKRELEIRCYLALAMIHAEKSETSKARLCLESAEKYSFQPVDLKASFHLVKFTIFLKEGNIDFAENGLKEYILNHDCDFEEIRNMLEQWISFLSQSEMTGYGENTSLLSLKVTEMFKLFAGRFQSDPEYTKIRIAHLQAMLTVSNIHGDDDKSAHRIFEIASRIVTDHCLAIHKLTSDTFRIIRTLLLQQVKQYYELHGWNATKIWSELTYKLLDFAISDKSLEPSDNMEDTQDDVDIIISVLGAKVEAHLQLQQFSEAIDSAQLALAKKYCTRSVVTFFKSLIYFETIPPQNLMERLSAVFEKGYSSTSSVNKPKLALTAEETFEQLLMCLSVCKQALVPGARKNKVMTLLLRYWVKLYCELKPWKHETLPITTTSTEPGTESRSNSFLSICCQYFSYYLSDLTYIEAREPSLLLLEFQRFFDESHPFVIPLPNTTSNTNREAPPEGNSLLLGSRGKKRGIGSDSDYYNSNSVVLDVLREVYPSFRLIYTIVEEAIQSYPLRLLGEESQLEWLGNTAAAVGTRLINFHKYLIDVLGRASMTTNTNHSLSVEEVKERGEILCLAADYLTTAEDILSLLLAANRRSSILKDRIRYLVLAAAARLDYIELVSGRDQHSHSQSQYRNITMTSLSSSANSSSARPAHPHLSSDNNDPSQTTPSLSSRDFGKLALTLAQKAVSLINHDLDFADEEDKDLLSNALILQFAGYQVVGESDQSEQFMTARLKEVELMPCEKLQVLVEMVEQSRNFSLDAFRLLLDHAIQTLQRDLSAETTNTSSNSKRSNDRALIGWMYRKLIELSPSRRYAIEKITEFEGLLKTVLKQHSSTKEGGEGGISLSIINHEDLDRIVAQSYNYSVTLIDLDQYSLAEQFLLKAQTLAVYGSDTCKGWVSKMKETHSHIQSLMRQETRLSNQSNFAAFNHSIRSSTNNNNNTSNNSNDPQDNSESTAVIHRLKSPEVGKLTVSMDALQATEN